MQGIICKKAMREGKNQLREQKEKGKDGGSVKRGGREQMGGREGGSHALVTEPGAGPKGYLIEIIGKSGVVGGGQAKRKRAMLRWASHSTA